MTILNVSPSQTSFPLPIPYRSRRNAGKLSDYVLTQKNYAKFYHTATKTPVAPQARRVNQAAPPETIIPTKAVHKLTPPWFSEAPRAARKLQQSDALAGTIAPRTRIASQLSARRRQIIGAPRNERSVRDEAIAGTLEYNLRLRTENEPCVFPSSYHIKLVNIDFVQDGRP
jgi:hypothetical protein